MLSWIKKTGKGITLNYSRM